MPAPSGSTIVGPVSTAVPTFEERAEPARRQLGRYSLHGEIASGGMATVYFGRLAGEGGFSRVVAIKCMHPHLANDPEFRAMFLDEARLAARIRHPNVVSTIDIGSGEGGMFLVMEYINGESLATLIKDAILRGERVPTLLAIRIVIDALYGLHAAHTATDDTGAPLSIVHRDVSPQNILVAIDGQARVLDFGIAKAAGRAHTTREGQLKGKFRYMAPEQIQDHGVTAKTDVYAMSVVLWELLTGEPLFRATNDAAIIARVLEGVIAPPSRLVEHIPPELDAVVKRGLARNPEDRFPTAEAMGEALEPFCAGTTARQVGTWVTHVARDSLLRRNELIAGIDSSISLPTLPVTRPGAPSSSSLEVALAGLPIMPGALGAPYATETATLKMLEETATLRLGQELTGFEGTTQVRDIERAPDTERMSGVMQIFKADGRRAVLVAFQRAQEALRAQVAATVTAAGPRGQHALAWWKSATLPLTWGWRVVLGAAIIVTLIGAVTFRSARVVSGDPADPGAGQLPPATAENPPPPAGTEAPVVPPPEPSGSAAPNKLHVPRMPEVKVSREPPPAVTVSPSASVAAPTPSASASAAPPASSSHLTARANCTTPYFIDSQGFRRVKKQCL